MLGRCDSRHQDKSTSRKKEDLVLKQTIFKRIIARASFRVQDRMDIQYAVKEAAKGMANPKQSDWDRLLRIAKYILGHKRYVIDT